MTVQHEVIVDEIGGGTVITCNAFSVRNLELTGKVNEKDIKSTLIRQCHIDPKESRADFTVRIIDNRPTEPEDYNAKKERESQAMKAKRNRVNP